MSTDRNGLEILGREECMLLLSNARYGRVGVSVDALPVVLPVNFALDDEEIVIQTSPGTKLHAALAGAVVAFEADRVDIRYHTGWSVLVQGRSRMLGEHEAERARRLPLRPWSEGARQGSYVAIAPDVVTGRRLV